LHPPKKRLGLFGAPRSIHWWRHSAPPGRHVSAKPHSLKFEDQVGRGEMGLASARCWLLDGIAWKSSKPLPGFGGLKIPRCFRRDGNLVLRRYCTLRAPVKHMIKNHKLPRKLRMDTRLRVIWKQARRVLGDVFSTVPRCWDNLLSALGVCTGRDRCSQAMDSPNGRFKKTGHPWTLEVSFSFPTPR